MPDPDRYVSIGHLEDELPYTEEAFDARDWIGLLERLLDEESERIEGDEYAGRTFDGEDDTVPGPIRDAVIRLVRSRLERIQTDGMSSESLGDGSSYSYRPPSELRRDVRSVTQKYRDDTEEGSGAFVV